MTTTRIIEYRITRDLLRRRQQAWRQGDLAARMITATAVTAALLVLGSYLPELLGVLLGAAAVLTIGTRAPE